MTVCWTTWWWPPLSASGLPSKVYKKGALIASKPCIAPPFSAPNVHLHGVQSPGKGTLSALQIRVEWLPTVLRCKVQSRNVKIVANLQVCGAQEP